MHESSHSPSLGLAQSSERLIPESPYARLTNYASHEPTLALLEPRLLLELAGQLPAGERLSLHFERLPRSWRFAVSADTHTMRHDEARAMLQSLLLVLAPAAQFKPAKPPIRASLQTLTLAPRADIVQAPGGGTIWFPSDPLSPPNLGRFLHGAAAYAVQLVTFSIASYAPSEEERDLLVSTRRRLMMSDANVSGCEARHREILDSWAKMDTAVRLEVEVIGPDKLSRQQQNVLCAALFGRAARTCVGSPTIDLRLALPGSALPAFRFWPAPSDLAPLSRQPRTIEPGPGVITLGFDSADERCCLDANARALHTSVLGGTGAGKTSWLIHCILEDIAGGEGVVVVDVHGDMSERIRSLIPPERLSDLVWVDASATDIEWRLDPLATTGREVLLERARLANMFISFFQQQYAAIPESLGPAFEMYFTNAFKLLLSAKDDSDRVLTKFEDIFADDFFRAKLLAECDDPKVQQFWINLAGRVEGENSLDNIGPYITNKMSQLSENPLAAALLTGTKPKLDLRWAMDNRKIVLLRIPVGEIGQKDSRYLGALFLMVLAQAASSRANIPEKARAPCRVYIDEFANLATSKAAEMLAEMRKFGLSLVLANQSLSQLAGDTFNRADVGQALLANCATFVLFRLSPPDALIMASIVAGVTPQELTQLGVGEVIVRRVVDGALLTAERLRTPRPKEFSN